MTSSAKLYSVRNHSRRYDDSRKTDPRRNGGDQNSRNIYADEKLSAEIKKINADACSGMAQAAYYYAAGETQKAEAKMLEVKKRTEEATAELRELQYWTEIANTIIKLAQVVGNLTIGGKTGKLIREYTEKRMSETPPKNSSTVTQHYDPEMQFKGVDKTVTTKW